MNESYSPLDEDECSLTGNIAPEAALVGSVCQARFMLWTIYNTYKVYDVNSYS